MVAATLIPLLPCHAVQAVAFARPADASAAQALLEAPITSAATITDNRPMCLIGRLPFCSRCAL